MRIGPLEESDFSSWTGSDLRKLREHFQWTQADCAQDVFEVSRATLIDWEKNKRDKVLPRTIRLAMIGAVLSNRFEGARHE